jgi:hypothetical protein
MRNLDFLDITGGSSSAFAQDEFLYHAEADPFQRYFDHLIAQGLDTESAWDHVWKDPALSAERGFALIVPQGEPVYA